MLLSHDSASIPFERGYWHYSHHLPATFWAIGKVHKVLFSIDRHLYLLIGTRPWVSCKVMLINMANDPPSNALELLEA